MKTLQRAHPGAQSRRRLLQAAASLLGGATLPLAALAAGRSVQDQMGRTVQLPARLRRLVAIPIPLASMVMAVDGGTARLSGINPAARDDLVNGLLGKMFPAASSISTAVAGENFAPNVEALAAAAPDLVIQWGDRGEAIVRPIAEIGLPVLTLRYGDSGLAAGWLRLVGAALDKTERAEQLARWFERRCAEIARRASAVPAARRPRVLYLMRMRSALQAAGRGTSMDADIRACGGINVAAEVPGFAPVGLEQLAAWNPDVLLLNNFEPGLEPAAVARDPRFATLRAAREGRVYRYPRGGFRWDPPSQETPLALDWLFSVLHPARAEPGLRQRIAQAYLDLYGHKLSREEIDQVLQLQAHAGSRHYAALFGEVRR